MKALKGFSNDKHRSHRDTWLAVAGAIVVAISLGAGMLAPASASDSQGKSTKLKDVGPEEFSALGEQALGAVCTECHGWDLIFGGPRQTPSQWEFIVSNMVARGATATPEQLDLIRRYLKWSWGVVWINSASAQDLVAVLALPEKDAEAIIAYRQEHGRFADLESLMQVPGIDAATIDAQADAIMFD